MAYSEGHSLERAWLNRNGVWLTGSGRGSPEVGVAYSEGHDLGRGLTEWVCGSPEVGVAYSEGHNLERAWLNRKGCVSPDVGVSRWKWAWLTVRGAT